MIGTRAQLRNDRLVWLLTLQLRGREYRFSTEAVNVVNNDDEQRPSVLRFLSGLGEIPHSEEIAIADEFAEPRSVPVSVVFRDANREGWGTITRAALDLGDATAELAEWRHGSQWADRQVVVRGLVDEVRHGAIGDAVAFTISEEPKDDRSSVPPPSWLVSEDNWPRTTYASTHEVDEQVLGVNYGLCYGTPGVVRGDDDQAEILPMPALLVEIDDITGDNYSGGAPKSAGVVLCGGDNSVVGSSFTLANVTYAGTVGTTMVRGGKRNSATAALVLDLNGQKAAHAFVAGTTLEINIGDELYWSPLTTTDGGVWNEARNAAMRGAGDIVADLLSRSTLRVDWSRMEAFRRQANRWKLDFFVNEPASAWSILEEKVLPVLQASAAYSSEGLYFVWWPWDAEAHHARVHIDTSKIRAERVSDVQWSSPRDVGNALTVNYAYDMQADRYVRRIRYTPLAEPGAIVHPLSEASYSRYGWREIGTSGVDLDVVYDVATAHLYATRMLRRYGQTYARVSLQLPRELRILELGDVVQLTMPDVGWSSVLCVVTGVPRGPEDGAHEFRTLSWWLREGVS